MRYKLSYLLVNHKYLIDNYWCFRKKKFQSVSEKNTQIFALCSELSTTLSCFWCSNRRSKTFHNILDSAMYFFFTLTAKERLCLRRKWKVNISGMLLSRWSVRNMLWYRTVMTIKYGWLTWRLTKSGAPKWILKLMGDLWRTSDKPNCSAGEVIKDSIFK